MGPVLTGFGAPLKKCWVDIRQVLSSSLYELSGCFYALGLPFEEGVLVRVPLLFRVHTIGPLIF